MNHFPFHIGDYAEATGHLSFIEDATYFRCIRKYYSTEKALPREISQVQRLIGAKTKEEKNSVEVVLNEFFILEEDGWHNKRCDQELEKYREGSKEDQERKAHEKERLRRYREERSLMFKALRELDIVPKYDINMDALRDLFNKNCNAPVLSAGSVQSHNRNALDTHTDTAITNQEPITNNQEPIHTTHSGKNLTPGVVCSVFRSKGISSVNPSNPKLHALITQGVPLSEFEYAAGVAIERGKGFAYAIGIVEGRLAESKNPNITKGLSQKFDAVAYVNQGRAQAEQKAQEGTSDVIDAE
jgi:uncharacterized protein YdaU (DUF1376 family)